MVSTVTTSTVSVVTTMIGFGLALGVVAVITLLAFFCVRELISASRDRQHKILAVSLDVGIVPLLITFGAIVVARIVEILAH